jgi:serine protease Do
VAERAGIKRHDVITAVDGRPVDRVGELQQLIAQRDPGDEVLLTIQRYGKQLQYRVRLQEATRRAVPTAAPTAAAAAAGIGIEVADLDGELAARYGFERAGGAVITRVLPGSAASQKEVLDGSRILSVDEHSVADAREARRLLRGARPGHVLSLVLQDSTGGRYIFNLRVP